MCVWAEAKAEKIRTKTNGTERGRESLHFGSIPISSFGREMNFCIFHVYTHKVCGGGGGSFVVFDGRVTIRTFPPVFFQSFAPHRRLNNKNKIWPRDIFVSILKELRSCMSTQKEKRFQSCSEQTESRSGVTLLSPRKITSAFYFLSNTIKKLQNQWRLLIRSTISSIFNKSNKNWKKKKNTTRVKKKKNPKKIGWRETDQISLLLLLCSRDFLFKIDTGKIKDEVFLPPPSFSFFFFYKKKKYEIK